MSLRTLRRCANVEEAIVVAGLLKSEGFHPTISNFHHAMMDWWIVQALGGVEIKVLDSEWDAAKSCIISMVESAPERLEATFGRMEAQPLRRPRLRVISMIFLMMPILFWPILFLLPAYHRHKIRRGLEATRTRHSNTREVHNDTPRNI